MLLACDPGVHACGMARFSDNGRLVWADLVPTAQLRYEVSCLTLALERQYITFKHPRPQDIVDLAFAAGVVKGLFLATGARDVREYKPVQWKGSVPKKIHQKRILDRLSPEEIKILSGCKMNHNVVDAVGLGLFALGRTQ